MIEKSQGAREINKRIAGLLEGRVRAAHPHTRHVQKRGACGKERNRGK